MDLVVYVSGWFVLLVCMIIIRFTVFSDYFEAERRVSRNGLWRTGNMQFDSRICAGNYSSRAGCTYIHVYITPRLPLHPPNVAYLLSSPNIPKQSSSTAPRPQSTNSSYPPTRQSPHPTQPTPAPSSESPDRKDHSPTESSRH